MSVLSPVLYCDVDGVINITKRSLSDVVTHRVKRAIPLAGVNFPVRVSFRESIVDLLKMLPVDWFWLTTWNYDAARLLEPLTGLKSVGVLDYQLRLRELNRETGKYSLVQAHQILNPRPFIWVDNVATKNYRAQDWEQLNVPHLIIRPNKRYGITSDHVAQMKDFLQGVNTPIPPFR